MNIKPPQITESVSELKILLRKTPVGYQKQRLTALYLFRSGQATTRKQAAALIGVHRKTIGHLATYASEGLDAGSIQRTTRVVWKNRRVFPVINR